MYPCCIGPLTSACPPQAYPERYTCIVSVSRTYRFRIDTIEASLAVLSANDDTHWIHVRYELGVLTPSVVALRIAANLYRNCIVIVSCERRNPLSMLYRSLVSCLYRACIDHLSRYSILNVSNVYRNGIEKRYSIEAPMEPKTYRVCIERVSNKKCLDTVSRVVSTKSRYTFDTLRYTTIHFDTFMGKIHPDTWGKRPSRRSGRPTPLGFPTPVRRRTGRCRVGDRCRVPALASESLGKSRKSRYTSQIRVQLIL